MAVDKIKNITIHEKKFLKGIQSCTNNTCYGRHGGDEGKEHHLNFHPNDCVWSVGVTADSKNVNSITFFYRDVNKTEH